MNDPSTSSLPDPYALLAGGIGVVPAQFGDDGGIDAQSSLPADHPAWQRDVLAVSARVRALLATLRPVVVRALTFWDHAVRGVNVGGAGRLEVDPSGSYRLR